MPFLDITNSDVKSQLLSNAYALSGSNSKLCIERMKQTPPTVPAPMWGIGATWFIWSYVVNLRKDKWFEETFMDQARKRVTH